MQFTTTKYHLWRLIGLIFGFGFIFYTVQFRLSWGQQLDHHVQSFFNTWQNPVWTTLLTYLAQLTSPIILVTLMLGLAGYQFCRGQKPLALGFVGLVTVGNLSLWLIKTIAKRPRPMLQLAPASGYSFPSGHTFNGLLLLLICWQLIRYCSFSAVTKHYLQFYSVLGLSLIIISRLYLRNHFASDILASLLLAIIFWEIMTDCLFKFEKSTRFTRVEG
ncbi:phosphatase PAP2 family protein [Agrilactobacillus yilanensis]|uniref:Phosphatase PAP2 family protein n=1 Tax=Agrilactobacillus yilanensis TaxID=2485997 RepID=A0ABW4J6T9_9LACO|nr:phosphatase PAP2 family protein [Agrilactobacillus yilanensis]